MGGDERMNFLFWHEFEDAEQVAAHVSDFVGRAIAARLEKDGKAAIAVSGGTTPIRFFQMLSGYDLDWSRVTITLVDDRWVPEASSRSNAKLVRMYLLRREAAAATFLPLVTGDETPEAGADKVETAVAALHLPFAAVVLGLGKDGHTASLFPGGDRLAQALAPQTGRHVETMHAEAAVEPRVTLTLPVLLAADVIAIHIEGARKRAVLEAAMAPGPVEEMPIRAVLAREPAPDIFWCP
jgi:6-phosphogluconolactonase